MNFTSFLPLLAELLLKSAAIILAAVLVDRAWRHASAAQRHAIWLAAFAALLLLPATRLVAPHWKLAPARPAEVRVRITNEAMAASSSVSEPVVASAVAVSAPTPPSRAPWVPWLDGSALVINLWLAGAVTLLGRRALGSLRLRALRRASLPASDAQFAEVRRIAAEFCVTRAIALRVSSTCRVPLTWGTLRPVLMLPEDAAAWPTDRLRAALRHELAHIRRGDYALRLFADVVRALYWPNPLVWFASRALRTAQEQACDDLVLNAGTCPTDYATLLCEAARRCIAPHGAVAMAQPSTLESRIRAIVDATRDRRPLTIRAAVLGAAFVALALAASTAAQLGATEPAPAAPEASTPAEVAAAPAPVDAAAQDKIPSIRIDAKIVEIATDASVEKVLPALGIPAIWVEKAWQTATKMPDGTINLAPIPGPPYVLGVLTGAEYQPVARKLDTTKGVRILACPRLFTRSKQTATIATGRDLRYATAWEKGGARGMWKPSAFETKIGGLKLEFVPEVGPDGHTVDLGVKSQIVEILGYTDPDTGKPIAAGKDEPEGEGPRRKAVFSTDQSTTTVSIFDGQTVVMELARSEAGKPFANKTPKAHTLVFATASMVPPNGEKAPAPAPKPGPPQIEIEAKFIQITPGKANAHAPIEKSHPTSESMTANRIDALLFGNKAASFPFETVSVGALGAPFQNFVADALEKKNGVDVCSAPKVTTKSGQRAVIEIIRERRYATEWKEGTKPGKWKPTAFETRNTGTTFEVEPKLQPDGTIALDLTPQVVDFLGFENLDTGKPMPRGTDDSAPEGPRLRAVFSGLKLTTKAVVKDGETIKLGPLPQSEEVKPFANRVRSGETVVFVTASIILPNGEKVAALTDQPAMDQRPTPVGEPVPGKPGYVTSPFAPTSGYVDVRGIPSGTEVRCPYTQKLFLVP